jgi:hypothetical protein
MGDVGAFPDAAWTLMPTGVCADSAVAVIVVHRRERGMADSSGVMRVLGSLAVLLAVLVTAVGVLLGRAGGTVDISFEIAKGLISLIVAIIVTGFVTFLLNRHSQDRARREERVKTLTGALQELKAAYEEVNQTRFLLGTSPTPKTFMEQIPAIGRARARLQRVQRERFILDTQVEALAQSMLDYLSRLGQEYRDNHPDVLRDALLEEAAYNSVRSGKATDLNLVSLDKTKYPVVFALTDHDSWRADDFHTSYRNAKELLHDWINRDV